MATKRKVFKEFIFMDKSHSDVLQKSALFQGIDNDDFVILLKCLIPQVKHYSKNEIILLSGDSVKHIGIIVVGNASAYLEHIDGSQTLISNLTPMNVFGEILVSTRTHKSPVTIHATSDAIVAFIEYQRVYSMCETACSVHRIFLQNMLKVIGDKYFYLFDRIAILREKTLRSRIIAYLHTLMNSEGVNTVTIPFSKTVLADYLLVNRSALSKELRKMENDDIVSVKGRNFFLKSIDKS